ncbi:glycosyltransferase [Streptomyces sp. 8N706]|uniref:glycosyltransferase n=1 Tax=Streptomyces sp. 8N706 TaxID=3457416 RepID=UPI003FD281F1
MAATHRMSSAARISVIVIGYNDAEHIAHAVLSALRQGVAVAEVVVVDDASTDTTADVLDHLAARYRRVRVVRRRANSGGCGTPRNDGLRHATAPYVMFLDSDDALPPGAADALLSAAVRHGAQVVAGACVRRELPEHRDVPWQRALFRTEVVHESPAERPRLVRDTLCVNKLYERSFLTAHGIAFPEGAFPYEDFVFTARVLAASPRVALIPETVYHWHVRRSAARPSISLDRGGVENWRSRLEAHRRAVEIFEEAGQKRLAHEARVKFLDHDLRMYVRELGTRGNGHRAEWWRLTREHLASFDESELLAARAPARWLARVVSAAEGLRDLERLTELANRPARLLPPYARVAGRPVWSTDLPEVVLDRVDSKPLHRLPVSIDAEPGIGGRPGVLRIRVHEMYGRLAAAGPESLDIELRHRRDGRLGLARDAVLNPEPGPGPGRAEPGLERVPDDRPQGGGGHSPELARDGPAGAPGPVDPADPAGPVDPADASEPAGSAGPASWTADVLLDLDALASRGGDGLDVWDIRARLHCAERTVPRCTPASAPPDPDFGVGPSRASAVASCWSSRTPRRAGRWPYASPRVRGLRRPLRPVGCVG